jgi:hypothetical protein
VIAFLAMQVSVDPRPLGSFVLLSGFVGPIPIAFGIPPKTRKSEYQARRRLGVTCVTYNCSRRRTPVIGENVTEIGLRVG